MSLTTIGATISSFTNGFYNNTVYQFTGAGQIIVSSPIKITVFVIAGGGGGGYYAGGGGGAGGVIYKPNTTLPAGTYNVSIGQGGNPGINNYTIPNGYNGGNSSIGSLFIAIGGGGGGGSSSYGITGGSSGGNAGGRNGVSGINIAGQGYRGGTSIPNGNGGGGGGAQMPGFDNSPNNEAGNGGNGFLSNITGTYLYYAGGGGGGNYQNGVPVGVGGLGGGGLGGGGQTIITSGTDATFYGGGGGGGSYNSAGYYGYQGIVIISISVSNSSLINDILSSVPNWLQYKSNRYTPFYVKGFFDISGNVIVRNGHVNMIDSDISVMNGNLTLNTTNSNTGSIIAKGNITCTNIISANNIITNNANFNAKTYISGNLNTNNILTTPIQDLSLNSSTIVYGNMINNASNLIVGNMTVGYLKSYNGSYTSCGAGYNIANFALNVNMYSKLQNNVIIGGNIAPLAIDINNSTLIGSNILWNNTTSLLNVTAVGAFSAQNPGTKTNSTYIGSVAGSTQFGNIICNQTNNTFIGANTYGGNDADSQTSIGYGCIKSLAVSNIMYVGTTSTTINCQKLNIGPAPGSLGHLNVDGDGLFLSNIYTNDISMNLNSTSFSNTSSIYTAINKINTTGFMISACYTGNWTAGAYFGIMGGVQDASSVIVMPNCYVYAAVITASNAVTGTNLIVAIGKNGTFAGNASNQLTFTSGGVSYGTDSLSSGFAFGLKFNKGDELSVLFSSSSSGTTVANTVFKLALNCNYFL